MREEQTDLIGQPTREQRRKAAGLFLIGFGAPICGAILYIFLPGRRSSGSLWDAMAHTPRELAVLLIGGGIGLFMVLVGWVLLRIRQPDSSRR